MSNHDYGPCAISHVSIPHGLACDLFAPLDRKCADVIVMCSGWRYVPLRLHAEDVTSINPGADSEESPTARKLELLRREDHIVMGFILSLVPDSFRSLGPPGATASEWVVTISGTRETIALATSLPLKSIDHLSHSSNTVTACHYSNDARSATGRYYNQCSSTDDPYGIHGYAFSQSQRPATIDTLSVSEGSSYTSTVAHGASVGGAEHGSSPPTVITSTYTETTVYSGTLTSTGLSGTYTHSYIETSTSIITTMYTSTPAGGAGPSSNGTSPTSASNANRTRTPQILGAVFGVLGSLFLLLVALACWRRSRRRGQSQRRYDEWIRRKTSQRSTSGELSTVILGVGLSRASMCSFHTAEAYMSETSHGSIYRYGAVARSMTVSPPLVITPSPEPDAQSVTTQHDQCPVSASVSREQSLSSAPEMSPTTHAPMLDPFDAPFLWATNTISAQPKRLSRVSSESAQFLERLSTACMVGEPYPMPPAPSIVGRTPSGIRAARGPAEAHGDCWRGWRNWRRG
ncbi:hypothetical protein IEO21_02296 [Rhodonia placenta]|uniref:Uncharacterized protein n=1 Tax=Rhodonia placenta TaxID=104341 RepID=A0A8H7P809_9APHY|nr:hypothetical protein IEO21_02296 [Postia placenta]